MLASPARTATSDDICAGLSLKGRPPDLATRAISAFREPSHLSSASKIVDVSALIEENTGMNETTQRPALPDHLSVDPRSPHHNATVFEHDVGIRLNDIERSNIEEYCISEGWVKVPAGKTLDRKGRPLLIKIKGKVEAFYK